MTFFEAMVLAMLTTLAADASTTNGRHGLALAWSLIAAFWAVVALLTTFGVIP